MTSSLPLSVTWTGDAVEIIDQRLLPAKLEILRLETVDDVVDAIDKLAVRGANAIGSVGALGVAMAWRLGGDVEEASRRVVGARPTGVNLRSSVDEVLAAIRQGEDPVVVGVALLERDRVACRAIGEHGRALLVGVTTLLTHCNTGRLATTGWGTALGIVYAKAEAGERVEVLATETRPLLQGARLTAWELSRSGIDVQILVDGAAAAAFAAGKVDAVVVGADRIAANGDTANKIGTLGLAVAAAHWGVPFYVAASLNAIDASLATGSEIPIEERHSDEVLGFGEVTIAPVGVGAWNPAFDVTPASLITAFITEAGVLTPPFTAAIADVAGG